ncbi:MAG: MarR family transcriptional regulator [Propionivibrio sp.]
MEAQPANFGFLLADVSRLMRRAFKQRMKKSDLTLAQSRALLYVARHQGASQVELADFLEVQPITVARLIDRLCADDLVERRADPADRRAWRLFLLPAAARHLAAIERVARAVRADALRGLRDEQAELLTSALQQVRSNFCTR